MISENVRGDQLKSRWMVVIACIIGLAFSFAPVYFQTFGLFMKPMGVEFGWGRTQLSAAISMAALGSAFAAPAFGRAVDRFGPRGVALFSTVGFSGALALLWCLPNRYPAYLAMVTLVGIVGTGCSMISYMSVLPRWFNTKLGTSFALAITGIGIGQFIMPLYAHWLLQALGWRLAYVALAASVFAITVPNALFLLADGPQNHVDGAVDSSDQVGVSYAQALRMPIFWRLAALVLFITIATTACMVHIVPLLTDRGVRPGEAASAAAVIGVAALTGRFVVGILLDYVSASVVGLVSFAGCTAGILLILSGAPGLPVYIGVILVGAGLGAENDLVPFVVRRIFGCATTPQYTDRCLSHSHSDSL